MMKKIEAIITPSEIERVKNALSKIGICRMKISHIYGVGSQKSHREFYRGEEYLINGAKEIKLELIVSTDEMVRQVVETIKKSAKTEGVGDEEIFVSPIEEVIRFGKSPYVKCAI